MLTRTQLEESCSGKCMVSVTLHRLKEITDPETIVETCKNLLPLLVDMKKYLFAEYIFKRLFILLTSSYQKNLVEIFDCSEYIEEMKESTVTTIRIWMNEYINLTDIAVTRSRGIKRKRH